MECVNAAEFQFPREPVICYFYNPFQEVVLRKVLENMRRSLAAAPREIYILYLNPVHRCLLDDSGFLTPVKRTPWYSIHKASGAAPLQG